MTIAVVLGGANSVWQDLQKFEDLAKPDVFIATNDAGEICPERLDHWVTLHPEKFPGWAQRRRDRHLLPDADRVWFYREPSGWEVRESGYPKSKIAWSYDWGGSSGLLAVKIAMELGIDHIVLCGVPMESSGAHFFSDRPWAEAAKYQRAWQGHYDEIAPFTRSMSGWTAELLGEPERVWLSNQPKESASGTQGNS